MVAEILPRNRCTVGSEWCRLVSHWNNICRDASCPVFTRILVFRSAENRFQISVFLSTSIGHVYLFINCHVILHMNECWLGLFIVHFHMSPISYVHFISCPASGATVEHRTRDPEVPGSKLACAICFFPLDKEINRHC